MVETDLEGSIPFASTFKIRKNKMKLLKPITFVLCFLFLIISLVEQADAQRRGGGRSSFGSSRSSSSRSSKSNSWGSSNKSSKASKPSSSWSKSKKSTNNRTTKQQTQKSKTDQAAYKKAVSSGTAFKTKKEAQAAFKEKHSKTYTSKYSTKPEKRPEHIPMTTKVNGSNVNITYNQTNGGYGHWGGGGPGLGTFIMYDMMTDMVMMNMMMNQHNYHHGPAPSTQYVANTTPHSNNGIPGLVIFLIFAGLAIVLFICFVSTIY